MNDKSKENEGKPAESTIDGPGSQLRKARERLGLEQSKVAAQLHLSRAIIQALEWDDYEKLPSAVFVKGYLRNYARLVKVNEDAVIAAFMELNPAPEQKSLPKSQPEDVSRELHGDPRLFRYISWVVALVLGLMVFFWWQGRIDEPETVLESPPESESLPGFSDAPELMQDRLDLNLTSPAVEAPVPEAEIVTPYQAEADSQAPVQETVVSESGATGSGYDADQSEATDDSVAVTDMADSLQSPLAEPEISSVTEAPEPIPQTAAVSLAPEGTLLFEFTGECWIEVRDASGRARILGVKGEGLRRILNTNAGPFKVVIGDITAVNVSVDGEPYDLKAHARGKVARFTLDPARL